VRCLWVMTWLVLTLLPCDLFAATTGSVSSLERFIDGVMARSIVAGETVGATVAVVQNDRLVVARGYGFADFEQKIPVQSRVSQFRIGSISKVLVWMSVLQLVEAGKLDLDADVNDYLTEFALPTDFTDPVTLRHLMTHTPGFEDSAINLFVSGPRQAGTLIETLARQVPRRVGLPGNLVSYSNYGAALAGHIVAQVAGRPFDDYVETHIFKPLKMIGATTRQPVPKTIEATRAKGYLKSLRGPIEKGFTYVPLAPAGAASATALDMAQLMVELLNPRGTRVLSAASKAQMLSGAYISHPLVNGMTLGLYEMTRGGTRAVGHGGSTMLFNSQMILWPDEDMGMFVSTNTIGGERVANALVETVAGHLGFSSNAPPGKSTQLNAAYLGDYITARRNHSNRSKILALADTIQVRDDGTNEGLIVTDSSGTNHYQQIEPGVFQSTAGVDRILFKNQSPQAAELYTSNRPMTAYNRATRAQTTSANGLLLVLWLLLGAGVVLVWPVSSITHRSHEVVRGQRLLSLLTYSSVAVLLFFAVQLADSISGPYELMLNGFDDILPLLWYPVVFAALVLLRLFYLIRVWTDGFWWLSRRFHFTCLLITECGLVSWFWYWNLMPEVLLAYLK
jgi:CubicO group peptidase (beta-lactamase class C family)